jgi:hypothetical protein
MNVGPNLEYRSSSAPLPATRQSLQPTAQQRLPTFPPATATVPSPLVVLEENIQSTIEEKFPESEQPTSVNNVMIAKDTEQRLQELVANEKNQERHRVEELAIPPRTPTRGIGTVAPPLDNPFASPGLKSVEQFVPIIEKGPEGTSANPSTIPPPSTLLRKQTLPNTSKGHGGEYLDWAKYQNTPEYISKHPKCALNLVCYRTGTKGCELRQIQTVLESRFEDKQAFKLALKETPSLISTDTQFFRALRGVYQDKMCGFWRKALCLKTLRGIRLLSVRPPSPSGSNG